MKRVVVTYSIPEKAPPYVEAARAAGLEPQLVGPKEGALSLAGFDGLMLTGGADLNPRLYGQAAEARTQTPEDDRDALELALLREALERDLPVLAICRGLQLFNVAHEGGTLRQHIEGHAHRTPDPSLAIHAAIVEPGSLLLDAIREARVEVNSRHHQAVDRLGEGLAITARAPDGVVEAIERPDRRFALAVQWHPEDQLNSAPHRRLFDAFAEACGTAAPDGRPR